MKQAVIIGDEILWAGGHPLGHPLRPERLQDTWDMLQAYNALAATNVQIVPPRFPQETELTYFHTQNYVDAVRHLSQGEKNVNPARYGFGQGDNPIFAGMFESEALKVGGGLVGTELLLNNEADVVFNFAGGLHHAGKAHASGFCVFGDATIAIYKMLDVGQRVVYIDIDGHHGDGVQNAFYNDPRVLTISFHESGLYLFPGTGFEHEIGAGAGEGYSVNIPLLPYTDDESFVWAFDQIVPPLLERFRADVVVAQLGLDAHWSDPLTHLSLTTQGFEILFQRIHDLSPRWLAVGGGGYEPTVVPRGWTLAWGVMSGQQFADELPETVANGHNPPLLHDAEPAPLSDMQREQARNGVEEVVKRLKKLLKLQ